MNAFIDEHRARCGVEPICTALQVAPSAYRRHAARRRHPALLPQRAKRDALLLPEVQRVFDENLRVYGADKVWRQLLREGLVIARCTVERLMRLAGLRGVRRGKSVPWWPLQIPPPVATQTPPGRTGWIMGLGLSLTWRFWTHCSVAVWQAKRVRP